MSPNFCDTTTFTCNDPAFQSGFFVPEPYLRPTFYRTNYPYPNDPGSPGFSFTSKPVHMQNCLAYALRFWKKNPRYRIYYDGCHVINSRYTLHDDRFRMPGWYMPLETDDYRCVRNTWVEQSNLLDEEEQALLYEYFHSPNPFRHY